MDNVDMKGRARTDEEIVARIKEVEEKGDDIFGFIRMDLISYLPFNIAKPFLEEDTKEEDLKLHEPTREHLLDEMRKYMDFAVKKAINHRGLSASRSINHYEAWAWLMGDEFDWENYTNYGCPILKAICEKYGFPVPTDEGFLRMAEGKKCGADYQCGCGEG